jgi:filamentous hemagglutinin family protein
LLEIKIFKNLLDKEQNLAFINQKKHWYAFMKISSAIWFINGTILCNFCFLNSINAQVAPDATLSNNSVVTTPDENTIQVDGGSRVGDNLFHSFQQFSVPTDNTAFFNNAVDIKNVFSRVTGGSISEIDGTIKANGAANLFLVNPSGIIFGPNARLDVGGSFLATTANSIQFSDGFEFIASASQTKPLLTINAPIGLNFRDNPGKIVNSSIYSVDKDLIGLRVEPDRTLALVGGDIAIEGGFLSTPGGRIELGSVGSNSVVSLTPIEQGWQLGYEGVQNFQDLSLSGAAYVYSKGDSSGDIQIQGRQISLTEGSDVELIAQGTSEDRAGNLIVKGSESVTLSGNALEFDPSLEFIATYFANNTENDATGEGSKLTVETPKLIVNNGARIFTNTKGSGQSPDVQINAPQIELDGAFIDNEISLSVIAAEANETATGNGGKLTINTERLNVKNGAQISASTFGKGNAGDLSIEASEIELAGKELRLPEPAPSGLFAQVNGEGTGNGGTLSVSTGKLIVKDGAQISTAARNSGNAGDINITASNSILLSGAANIPQPGERDRSGLFVSAEQNSTGNGGNLKVNTKLLTIEKGARISADTFGTGKAGNVTLNLDRLIVRDGGLVRAGSLLGEDTENTLRGDGGTLTISAKDSVQVIGTGKIGTIPVNSSLFTQAEGTGNAGNLNIFTPNLSVKDGGEINLSATGTGQAGNLKIESNNTQLDRGTITAATANGEGGNISLQAKDLLLLRNSSKISAQATGEASGGNINIDSQFIVAKPNQNNDIIANAQRGKGGNINIATEAILGLEERKATSGNQTNDIDASSDFGLSGNVSIETPDVNPFKERVQPPDNLVEPEEMSAQACSANQVADTLDEKENTFTITGRGGMPHSPTEPLRSEATIIGGVSYPQAPTQTSDRTSNNINSDRLVAYKPNPLFVADRHIDPNEIVPARGAIVNEKGQVVLTAYPTPNIGQRNPKAIDCLGKIVN